MEAAVLTLVNSNEIEEAKDFEDIEPIYEYRSMLFDVKDVTTAHITPDNDIRIYLPDGSFDLMFNEMLWGVLKQKFNVV